MLIRRARPEDAPAIAAIYDHYVRHTAITFAVQTPTAEHYARQIGDVRYPFLVAEESGRVSGFFYAAPFRQKEAYRWDVELTVYLAPDCGGRGLGQALMAEGLDLLKQQGYLNAYSCITLPNEASLKLHRRFGFEELGIFPKSGYKLGKWHDVIWVGKVLGAFADDPAEPRML